MKNNKNMWLVIGIIIIICIIAITKSTSHKDATVSEESDQVQSSENTQSETPEEKTPQTPATTNNTHTTAPVVHQTTSPQTAQPPAPISGTATVSIKDFKFNPSTITIKAGSTVIWRNDDATMHTIVADQGTGIGANSDKLSTGESYPYTFPNPGTFTYHCGLHPSMKGTIVVVK